VDNVRATGDAVFGRCPQGLVTFMFAVTKDPTADAPKQQKPQSQSTAATATTGEFPEEEVPMEDVDAAKETTVSAADDGDDNE
jgi:hypothetical protein